MADISDLYQVVLVISDGVKSKEKDDGCREAEFLFLWQMFGSHNLKHTLLSVMNGHCVLPPSTFRPSALSANKCCSLRFLNVDVSFSSSREWLIRFSLCCETSLDFASSVWYPEKRRICVGVSVQTPSRIF